MDVGWVKAAQALQFGTTFASAFAHAVRRRSPERADSVGKGGFPVCIDPDTSAAFAPPYEAESGDTVVCSK